MISLKGMKQRWSVEVGHGKTYGKTKAEVLELCAGCIAEAEAKGQPWTLNHEWIKARTSWPKVVIVSRTHDQHVESFTFGNHKLHWTDSCGSRSVFWYGEINENDYDKAKDIPSSVYQRLVDHVITQSKSQPELMMRRDDPGLGIYIPEIDDKIAEAGGVPDGCIPAK